MTFNDEFTDGAIISIYSFLKNNTWFDGDIIIGYISNSKMGLNFENRERINNLYHKVKFVEINENTNYITRLKGVLNFQQTGCGFEQTLLKFHAFTLSEYDRVFLMDADVLVVEDVKDLFFNEYIKFGVTEDLHTGTHRHDFVIRKNEYFAAGFMTIGKEYITTEIIDDCVDILTSGKLLEDSCVPHFKGLYPEQDLLNLAMMKRDVILLPSSYQESRFRLDEEGGTPKIIHYLTKYKPWKKEPKYEKKGWTQDLWDEYWTNYNEWLNYYVLSDDTNKFLFNKDYNDKDKYLVFTCAKNENPYIREFVQHYLDLDFDKIVICDNNDNQDELKNILSDYIDNRKVELFNCAGFRQFQSGVNEMFYESGNYKWCGYFDCDEFLELGSYSSIKDYLATKECDCIAFNWLMFNNNGEMHYEDKPLQERFKRPFFPINNLENGFVKCILKGGHFKYYGLKNSGGHIPTSWDFDKKIVYNIGGYYTPQVIPEVYQSEYPPRYKEGYIKHYYTKSFDEWCNKSKRGWPDGTTKLPTERYFKFINKYEPKRDDYKSSAFIDADTLDKSDYLTFLNDAINKGLKVIIIIVGDNMQYPTAVRTMFMMSLTEGMTFIIKDEHNLISDELYNTMLEAAFVTNNKITYAKTQDEVIKTTIKHGVEVDGIWAAYIELI